jgi:hypothetical protein
MLFLNAYKLIFLSESGFPGFEDFLDGFNVGFWVFEINVSIQL